MIEESVGSDKVRAGIRAIGDDVLAQAPELTAQLFELARELDGYRETPADWFLPISETSFRFVVQVFVIEGRSELSEDETRVMRSILEERARLGVALGDFLFHAHRVQQAIWDAADEAARRLGTPPEVMSQITKAVVAAGVVTSREAADVYRQVEVEAARADEHRRSRILRSLLYGPPREVSATELGAYAMTAEQSVVPFRAQARTESDVPALRRALSLHAERGGIVGIVGSDVVGVVREAPSMIDIDAVVGVGPAALIASLPNAFAVASRAMEAAVVFGLRGIVRLSDVALKAAVTGDAIVGDDLVERYMRPLDRLRDSGQGVRAALAAFFDSGMSVDTAAQALYVHPNTLRYRLRRFEEITCADLSRTEELFGVWWALQRYEVAAT